MKNMIAVASFGILFSSVVLAQTEQDTSGFYVGAGLAHLKSGDSESINMPDNFALTFGYSFNSNWSAEFQYSDSYNKSETSVSFEDYNSSTEASLNTKSLFGVFRSSGPFYVKAKAGYMDAEAEYKTTYTAFGESGRESGSESENGWAAGIGAGYRFGNASIELDHTLTEDDLDIDFTVLSFNYAF